MQPGCHNGHPIINNLGGLGPDDGPEEMRFAAVGVDRTTNTLVDLKVTKVTKDDAVSLKSSQRNGCKANSYGVIHIDVSN